MLEVFLWSVVAVATLMVSVWVLSLALRDASIVDIFWGMGFVLVGVVAFVVGDGYDARKLLVLVLVGGWGLRLSVYLFFRNKGKGEDFRYQRMRAHWGKRFPLVSLFTVFGLQGLLMLIVSLPLQAANAGGPDSLTWLDWLGVTVWLIGFAFETVGDWQLSRFKANPENRGKVMDQGLWSWTRHPNYFGDCLVWWGIFLVAASEPAYLWTVAGPVVMTFLLVRVSGVALLERSLVKRRAGYEDYIARTSSFIPRPPRKLPASAAAPRAPRPLP